MLARERALRIALAEAREGVRETGPDTSKRIKAYQAADSLVTAVDTGYAWCNSFVVWCYREARRPLIETQRSAGVQLTADLAAAAEFVVRKPKRGDLVCFQFPPVDPTLDHIGFVLEVLSDGSIRTVEGNTSAPDGSQGDGVFVKVRPRSFCPTFVRIPGRVPAGVARGDKGAEVRELQRDLVAVGHKRLEVDGEFGQKTEKAVETFQRRSGVAETGVATKETLAAIAKALAPPEPPPAEPRKPGFTVTATLPVGGPQTAEGLSSRTAMHKQVNAFLDAGAKSVEIAPAP